MTDAIRAAHAVLQAEAEKLTAELAGRGYPKAIAQIWVRSPAGASLVYVDNAPKELGSCIGYGKDIVACIANVQAGIAKLPDANAAAAWFAWAPAEAAE